MNRDPFVRLALIAAVTAYLVALGAAVEYFGWWAWAAVPVSIAAAFLLTLERSPEPLPPPEQLRARQPEDGTRGFERIA